MNKKPLEELTLSHLVNIRNKQKKKGVDTTFVEKIINKRLSTPYFYKSK